MTYASEVLTRSPAGFWQTDETAGTTVVDDSGNSRDGTYSGSPTLGATSLMPTGEGTAVGLDGVNDRAQIPHNAAFNASKATGFTFAMGLKVTNPAANALQVFADKTALATGSAQWGIWWENRSTQGSPLRVRLLVAGAELDWAGTAARDAVAAGGLLVWTMNTSGGLNMYWNAANVATGVTAGTPSATTRAIDIGCFNSGGSFFLGGVWDTLAIFPTALTAPDVADLYAAWSGELSSALTLDAILPAVQDSLTIRSYTRTDTSNGRSGRIRGGYAIHADNTDPVLLPAAAATRRDKALWYPDPDMVDGRPT